MNNKNTKLFIAEEAGMDEKKFLHGNKARVNPEKNISPRFTNFVSNDYLTDYYHTLDDEDVINQKNEVDGNQK